MRPSPPKKKKLKKYQVAILVSLAILVCIYALGRLTNALQYYSIPSGSNEPTIKVGDHIFSSNLIEPKRFDFICYRMTDSLSGRQIWVHRLCGLPGDRIEIRNDTLFVNGENVDDQFNLRKHFVIPTINPEDYGISMEDIEPMQIKDSLVVILQTKKDSLLIRKGRPFIFDEEFINKAYNQPWTVSNFGPYTVPFGKYFVMGDNRHFSMDSRFTGPLDMEQYFGTVMGRK